MSENRTPAGVPTGGQFAASAKVEADVTLNSEVVASGQEESARDNSACADCYDEHHGGGAYETILCAVHEDAKYLPFRSAWHTDAPLDRMSLGAENRLAIEMVNQANDGHLALDAPYQRGSIWTEDQQIGLIKSMLSGVPVPAVIINDRATGAWAAGTGAHPGVNEPWAAVVDGKQRVEAMRAWFAGQVPVPSSWFDPDSVERTKVAADGTGWVTFNDLTDRGRARCENRFALPVARSQVGSVAEEAEVYLLVNGAGTAQSDDDMANAARVAGQ